MKLITISAIAIALVLTACGGSKPEGTYVSNGLLKGTTLVFKPNGKVNFMGVDIGYEMDGKNVIIHHPNTPDRPLILKPKDDGSFDSDLGNWAKVPSR
jgi:major membrane immunogen (membrane-anchored lipoprotein)